MKITAKDSDLQNLRDETQDRHYVDITERAHNHFIRYAVVKSYDINDVKTKTLVYSGSLHIPSDWTEAKLINYIHDRHTMFCDADCLNIKIIILMLYPLPSALAMDLQQDAVKVARTQKLIQVLGAVDDEEDEIDRKMRKLIADLEGSGCE